MVMVVGAEMGPEGVSGGGNDGGDGSADVGVVRERTRIYVGGLGESVTEDDLRKTFSTLGKIESVEVVRTKGRSFAYLDFLPSSDKSLPKLFSTYNGCMWKGGRLRLEKAKEHYLNRLKREWQEEAESATVVSKGDVDASEPTVSLGKPKKSPSLDKMQQLQIFFPKLRKVKSVAWSGTGKHKYSFQRVEVPALPLHFCDCEEHYVPPVTKAKTSSNLVAASGGMTEEELNIMNSVMNKLLKKEDSSNTDVRQSNLPYERNNSDNLIGNELVDNEDENEYEDQEMENEEEDGTDEDNLIINVVRGGNNRAEAFGRQSMDAIMAEQKQVSNKLQPSKKKPPQNKGNSPPKKSLPSSKKQKSSDAEEIVENVGTSSQLPLTTRGNKALDLELGTQQVKGTSSLKQKSSWSSLIDKKEKTQFSLTDIIGRGASQEEEESMAVDGDVPSITNKKEENPKTVTMDAPSITEKKEVEPKSVDFEIPSNSELKRPIRPDQPKNLEDPTEAPPAKPKEVSDKVARGASWLAKSSWTQLVSSTINSPFSISQVLPSLTSAKHDQVPTINSHVVNSTNNMSSTLKLVGNEEREDSSVASGNKDVINTPHPTSSVMVPMIKNDIDPANCTEEKVKEKSVSSLEKTQPLTSKQKSLGEFEFSETCPFMRTEESMKEWKKRKGARSASLRKKRKGGSE